MKRSRYRGPNRILKQERERRGWTQLYVAQQIGVDAFTISRWERGLNFPSPYALQKVSRLFGKTPEELGFSREESGGSSEAAPPPGLEGSSDTPQSPGEPGHGTFSE
jgi:transcriptional regulator with XRE-family HTH domain